MGDVYRSHEIYILFRRNCALYVLITMMTYINGVFIKSTTSNNVTFACNEI